MNEKKIPSNSSNVDNEKKRKNDTEKNTFSYSGFVLKFYSGRGFCCFIGMTAFLLKWSDSYMLPGNICFTANIPTALRTAWLNCSLFGNWVSVIVLEFSGVVCSFRECFRNP